MLFRFTSAERDRLRERVKSFDIIEFIAFSVFIFLFSDLFRRLFHIKVKYTNMISLIGIGIALVLLFKFKGTKVSSTRKFAIPLSVIPLIIVYLVFFYEKIFGALDVGAILFHVRHGFDGVAFEGFFIPIMKYLGLLIAITMVLSYLIGKRSWFRWVDGVIAVVSLLATPIASYTFGYLLYAADADVLTVSYVMPQIKSAPIEGDPKNLLLIYVESTERTFSELAGADDFFGDMMGIASQGIDVVGIRQVENTNWTIAGMVASQCGVPLQPAGSLKRNQFDRRDTFLPGVVCLGDLLKEQGYSLSFVGGADLAFAGKGKFLKQHGFDDISGLTELHDRAGDYLNDWGLYDDTLFEIAEERLEKLVEQDDAFVLSILTVGGHIPQGYPTQTCIDHFGPAEMEQMLFSMKCTGFHVKQFLENVERKNLLRNTVVVVMSDHLVMKNATTDQLTAHDRMNFFTAISDDIVPKTHMKNSATVDVFPTLLELLGFEVPGRRAGLGVSLFSKDPGLIESMGIDELNRNIRYGYNLSDILWTSSDDLEPFTSTVSAISR